MNRAMSRTFVTVAMALTALLISASVGFAALNLYKTGKVNIIQAVTETVPFSTTSSTWVDLPNASLQVGVGSGKQKYFIATFSGESSCVGASGWCSVRILVNGVEMEPSVGSNFAFDSTATDNVDQWESHSMQRVMGPVGSGQHIVKVQMLQTSSASFRMDDWTFTVIKAAG